MVIHPFTGWLLLLLTFIGGSFWVLFLVRMSRIMSRTRSARDGLGLPAPQGGWPTLSIVVPAHDEEAMIDACASRLRGQDYEKLEIVFVLDRCTDGTAAALAPHAEADPRIVVVTNETSPEDWAGKCYAAHLGARRATGQWLLFTDADTEFDPGLARASVAIALDRELALLSMLSTLTFKHRFERVAQLAAAIMLMIMFPMARMQRSKKPRPFANGQFMLFRRDWYERIGGHEAVKDSLLEDLAAAKLIHACEGRSEVVMSDGMLMCSMYDTLAAFKAGWKRIFIEACGRKPRRLRKWGWRTFTYGAALPLAQLLALAIAPSLAGQGHMPLALALVAAVGVGWAGEGAALLRIYAQARAPLWTILLFPLGCVVVSGVLLSAARDLERGRPVVWGRREYVLEPR